MTRFAALPLALVAAALLSACGSPGPDRTTSAWPTIQPQEMAYQPGSGVVQAVSPAPAPASAGGTAAAAPAAAPGAQRLTIRMDNGRVQYVDVTGQEIPRAGERVQLTADRQIIKQ